MIIGQDLFEVQRTPAVNTAMADLDWMNRFLRSVQAAGFSTKDLQRVQLIATQRLMLEIQLATFQPAIKAGLGTSRGGGRSQSAFAAKVRTVALNLGWKPEEKLPRGYSRKILEKIGEKSTPSKQRKVLRALE